MRQPTDAQGFNPVAAARVCRALADPKRVAIVAALAQNETSPSQMARSHNTTIAAMSHHFRSLERERLVCLVGTRPIRGTLEHLYALTPEGEVVAGLLAPLTDAVERLQELDADLVSLSRGAGLGPPEREDPKCRHHDPGGG